MPAILDEHNQWVDSAGKPLVNGTIKFGVQGADPDVSPITIFSDRELTVSITNPQTLDADGRTTNKVWVAGRYSILVKDLNAVQEYIELDNGESPDVGVTALENVAGGDTITATASSTITAYEDLEQYTFTTAAINTTAVTLNIDSVGAKSVVKNHDEPIQPGNFEADQNIIVSFNETDDVFEWVNQNLISVASYKGSDIADSATPTIPTDGDYFEYAGTTTTTTLTVANDRAFALKCTGIRTFTASASIVTEDGNDITTIAGQVLMFQSTAANVVQVTKAPGGGVIVQRVNTQTGAVATTTTVMPDDDTIPQNTEGGEFMTLAITPTNASNNLEIQVTINISSSASAHNGVALFQDSIAGALAGVQEFESAAFGGTVITFTHTMVAGTASATTFKVRAGMQTAGTLTFNGRGGARKFGGVMASSIIIKEIAV